MSAGFGDYIEVILPLSLVLYQSRTHARTRTHTHTHHTHNVWLEVNWGLYSRGLQTADREECNDSAWLRH